MPAEDTYVALEARLAVLESARTRQGVALTRRESEEAPERPRGFKPDWRIVR